jgi:hypothetical protein
MRFWGFSSGVYVAILFGANLFDPRLVSLFRLSSFRDGNFAVKLLGQRGVPRGDSPLTGAVVDGIAASC